MNHTEENLRLQSTEDGTNWKKFGPYLSERQWGTVREDYSAYGAAWEAFTHDESRSRVYRWGEDGLMGISDEKQFLCFAFAFWNGKDAILKERLFGLTGTQGNHSEDVKECYYYLDSTPTHSYMRMCYKYAQNSYPYSELITENEKRNKTHPEFELIDTGIFEQNKYFNIQVEYAKNTPNDIVIAISIENKSNEAAEITILPTLWFRNTWNWGYDAYKPHLDAKENTLVATHQELGNFSLYSQNSYPLLFTENETNATRLYGLASQTPYVKDAFHEYIINERKEAINAEKTGTKAAIHIQLSFLKNETKVIKLRLSNEKNLFDDRQNLNPFTDFDAILGQRKLENNTFYENIFQKNNIDVGKQLMAGMLWSKQYYEFNVKKWLNGDPKQFAPPQDRKKGRNATWQHIDNHDIISMPDKWEYPWFAAWDSAFHCIAIAKIDVFFAKKQLLMFLSDRYINEFGQIPAYEWAFGDVNPPVLSMAIWEIYCIEKQKNITGDIDFLVQSFDKLQLNFNWWLNTQTQNNRMIFGGGFLGLDNVAVIDRGKPLPTGYWLEQADGTAWMARFALDLTKIALEIAEKNTNYIEKALFYTKIFLKISYEINHPENGLWCSKTEFYHDKITNIDNDFTFLNHKNMVGLLPMIACDIIEKNSESNKIYFKKISAYITENIIYAPYCKDIGTNKYFFSLVPEEKFFKLKFSLFSKNEFNGNFGIRSLSYLYKGKPFEINIFSEKHTLSYAPRESTTTSFGENSNWRGPVWLPTNYVLLQSLLVYAQYYGPDLLEKRNEIITNLKNLFIPNQQGYLPIYTDSLLSNNPDFNKIPLFFEFFDPETGKGVGASHQTGWTGLMAVLLE